MVDIKLECLKVETALFLNFINHFRPQETKHQLVLFVYVPCAIKNQEEMQNMRETLDILIYSIPTIKIKFIPFSNRFRRNKLV